MTGLSTRHWGTCSDEKIHSRTAAADRAGTTVSREPRSSHVVKISILKGTEELFPLIVAEGDCGVWVEVTAKQHDVTHARCLRAGTALARTLAAVPYQAAAFQPVGHFTPNGAGCSNHLCIERNMWFRPLSNREVRSAACGAGVISWSESYRCI
jgi:hypothetical protein